MRKKREVEYRTINCEASLLSINKSIAQRGKRKGEYRTINCEAILFLSFFLCATNLLIV